VRWLGRECRLSSSVCGVAKSGDRIGSPGEYRPSGQGREGRRRGGERGGYQLVNHLGRLRAAGLVTAEHTGWHAVYRLAALGVGDVLAALSRYAAAGYGLAAGAAQPADRAPTAFDLAHSCYDHAAGRLGVAVFATLVERGALRPPDGRGDEVAVGPGPGAVARFGVGLAAVDARRRKLATACLDKVHRLPHWAAHSGRRCSMRSWPAAWSSGRAGAGC
jgi:hypothetical protein